MKSGQLKFESQTTHGMIVYLPIYHTNQPFMDRLNIPNRPMEENGNEINLFGSFYGFDTGVLISTSVKGTVVDGRKFAPVDSSFSHYLRRV